MGYIFDGVNKIIILTPGTTSFKVADMYSRWKDWVADNNAGYAQAFTVVGGDPLTGTNFIYPYFFLENGWRVRPQEANHQLIVDGALLVRGGGNPYLPTLGSYNVQIIADVPVRAEGVAISTNGVGTPQEVAEAVWNASINNFNAPNSFGERVGAKLLTIGKFLGLK